MRKIRANNFKRANYVYLTSMDLFTPVVGIRLLVELSQKINVRFHKLRSIVLETNEPSN